MEIWGEATVWFTIHPAFLQKEAWKLRGDAKTRVQLFSGQTLTKNLGFESLIIKTRSKHLRVEAIGLSCDRAADWHHVLIKFVF